jgi:hypothetical protein
MSLAFTSYNFTESGYILNLVDYCIDVIFFIDIIATFNTPYYSDKDMAYIGKMYEYEYASIYVYDFTYLYSFIYIYVCTSTYIYICIYLYR